MRPCDCRTGGSIGGNISELERDKPDESSAASVASRRALSFFRRTMFSSARTPRIDQKLPFYRDAKGKRFFIRSLLGHYQFLHATSMASLSRRLCADWGKAVRSKWSGCSGAWARCIPDTFSRLGKFVRTVGAGRQDQRLALRRRHRRRQLARAYDVMRAGGLVGADDARVIEDGLFRKCGRCLSR